MLGFWCGVSSTAANTHFVYHNDEMTINDDKKYV